MSGEVFKTDIFFCFLVLQVDVCVLRLSRGLLATIKPTPVHQIVGELPHIQTELCFSQGACYCQLFPLSLDIFLTCFSASPTPCALKIADKITEQFESAVLLMVRTLISLVCQLDEPL